MGFSVLLSLYNKEKPQYLKESLGSIFNQTLRANEIVLVEDGPITPELEEIVESYKSKFPELKIVKLEKNMGLGRALSEGLKHCTYELVARADTDDISKPNRFELQISYMQSHPDIDISSASVDEFIDDVENVISTRSLPKEHEAIYTFGQKRNPINHPVCVFKKSAVAAAGGYQHFYLFEDYYLWARMMMSGAKFHNLKESLLYFRFSPDMMKRRGGWKYAITEVKFQFTLYRIGYTSFGQMIENICIRFGVRIMPNRARKRIYSQFLRK